MNIKVNFCLISFVFFHLLRVNLNKTFVYKVPIFMIFFVSNRRGERWGQKL